MLTRMAYDWVSSSFCLPLQLFHSLKFESTIWLFVSKITVRARHEASHHSFLCVFFFSHVFRFLVLVVFIFFFFFFYSTTAMKPAMRLVTESNPCTKENTENILRCLTFNRAHMYRNVWSKLRPPILELSLFHDRLCTYETPHRLMICGWYNLDNYVFFGTIFMILLNN